MRNTPDPAGDVDTREISDAGTREMTAREMAADAALAEYLQRTERGEAVDRQAFLAEHPDVAVELAEFFAATDEIDGLLDLTFPEDAAAELDGARMARLGAPALCGSAGELASDAGALSELAAGSSAPRTAPTRKPFTLWQAAVGAAAAPLALIVILVLIWPAPSTMPESSKGEPAPGRPRRPFVSDVAWGAKGSEPKLLAPRSRRVNKLIGHWRFVGAEPAIARTAPDSSGFEHMGQLIGGLTWSDAGLELDGVDDCASLGNPPQLDFEGPITLAAWVKPLEPGRLQNMVAHGHEFAPPSGVFLRISGGKYQAGSWNGSDHLAEVAIPPGDLGTWVHLCGVYDGQAWRLYRQGELAATHIDPQGATLTPGNWAIGATGNLRERFFKGAVREVWIFDRAVTADEVRTLAAP